MKNNVSVPKIHLAAGGESLISSSGASLLLQTASISGLATGLSQVLAPLADDTQVIIDLDAMRSGKDFGADDPRRSKYIHDGGFEGAGRLLVGRTGLHGSP